MLPRLVVLLLLAAAVPAHPTPTASDLEPVPHPALADFEDGVRRQLEGERAALDGRLARSVATGDVEAADLASAFGRLGRLYHNYNLLEAAAACYQNARRLEPDAVAWIYLLGVIAERNGDLDVAAASFERALELRPGNPPALVRLGEIEVSRRNFDAAAGLFERALATEGTAAAAHNGLGKVAMARKDFAAAAEHFETTLALQPPASRVHYSLAQAYRRLRRVEEASAHLAQQGSDPVAIDDPLMAEVLAGSASATQHMQRGATARRAGQLERAVAEYRRAVELAPESPEARLGLAGALAAAESYSESIEQYREAVRLDPENAGIHSNLGATVVAAGGDGDEALGHFRTAVRLDPADRRFRRRLASQLATLGRWNEAAAEYRKLVAGDERDAGARLELAAVELELGDSRAARETAAAVLELDVAPEDRARALVLIAGVDGGGGEIPRAIELLRQAVELDPAFAAGRFRLASFLGMTGSYGEAAAEFREVRRLDPGNPAAWLGESTALVLWGREAEAVASLGEGLAALPGDARLAGGLARLLAAAADPALRDGERALKLARTAFEQAPSLELAETLAMAFATLGRFDQAVRWQERVVAAVEGSGDGALVARQRAALDRYRRGER